MYASGMISQDGEGQQDSAGGLRQCIYRRQNLRWCHAMDFEQCGTLVSGVLTSLC